MKRISDRFWPKGSRRLAGRIGAAVILMAIAPLCSADPIRPLGERAQARWAAVGQLQGPGFRQNRGCSGTLIATDLVVTAAHCLTGAMWQSEAQQFRAGLFKDHAAATRTYHKVEIHPLYNLSKRDARIPYDIAVVHLSDPIPPTEVTPIPLLSPGMTRLRAATLLGYRHDQPDVMSGRQNCGAQPGPHRAVMLFDCEVVSGTSGGAVIFETPDGPVLAGVIVARQNSNGYAIAVAVNGWLREKLSQALASNAATE